MLLEAVALVGFVIFIGSAAATVHGLIMKSYHETENRMAALSYAENVLASALTGVAYQPKSRETQSIPMQRTTMQRMGMQQKNIFKSVVATTTGVSLLPHQKPCTVVTVTVSWYEGAAHNNKEHEKTIVLTRVMVDE